MLATKRDEMRRPAPRALTVEQQNAIDLLAGGATDAAVAEAVGVHRTSIARWRTSPTFAAALNARRAELFTGAADALRALLPTALAVIGEALADADLDRRVQAAFKLLASAKLDAGANIGPTDPREIVAAEAARRKDEAERADRAKLGQIIHGVLIDERAIGEELEAAATAGA